MRRPLFFCVTVLLFIAFARGFEGTDSYELRTIEGWSVRVSAKLLAETELAARTLDLLRVKLFDANRAIPHRALDELRRDVIVWVELDGERFPGMCYHPSADWLRDNGFNPDKAGGIEVGNARNFLKWSREQPSMVIHELAHAWFDRLPRPQRRAVREAYERAKESGTYHSVLRASGQSERAYAMNNVQEYFAELSEACLGTNDFLPFVRAELQEHDRAGYDAIEAAWATEASTRPVSTTAPSLGQ
jgi:hypothetical protein